MRNLKRLELRGRCLSDLRPLESLKNVRQIQIEAVQCTDWTPYNSKESVSAYREFLIANCREPESADVEVVVSRVPAPRGVMSIADFADRFLNYAKVACPGKRGDFPKFVRALSLVVDMFGDHPATSFGPLRLAAIRDDLANKKQVREYRNRTAEIIRRREYYLTRKSVNNLVGLMRRWFKWGVSQELIAPDQLHALQTVGPVQFGRTKAIESIPRQPVSWEVVATVLNVLSPVVADMIRFHWHTGCRPQNVCALCPKEIDTTSTPWTWRPSNHKGQWRGHDLIIFIGPKAAEAVRPYLLRDPDKPCFSPREARIVQLTQQGCDVESQFTKLGIQYHVDTYLKAIVHGMAGLVDPRITQPYSRAKFEAAGIEYWTPHQLRHTKAQAIRDEFGLEAAQAVLGHASIAATQIYAKNRLQLAKELALKSG